MKEHAVGQGAKVLDTDGFLLLTDSPPVGSFWSCPVFIAHQLSASGFSSLAGSEAVDGPAAMRLSRCRGDNFFLSWRFLCSTWGPFLRPDLQRALGAVRRRRQGWASLRLRHKLWHLQPTP